MLHQKNDVIVAISLHVLHYVHWAYSIIFNPNQALLVHFWATLEYHSLQTKLLNN